MKKLKIFGMGLFTAALLMTGTWMAEAQDGFRCKTNSDNTITITGFNGRGEVAIPSTINGLPVTIIGKGAFHCNCDIISVTIPDSVTSIQSNAFWGCGALPEVTIPKSVTNIDVTAFCPCNNMTAITVDASNSVYSSVDGVLFDKNQTTLIQYPGGKAERYYTIPASVTRIGVGAFADCIHLTNVGIPNTLTNIGKHAFGSGRCLTSVTISDSVTSIGDGTFEGCDKLHSIIIPASVTNIGNEAFRNCGNMISVYFKGNAPSLGDSDVFTVNATIYYLQGTTGWGATFGGCPINWQGRRK